MSHRILIIAPFFPPQQAVASLRTYSFARSWADRGHDVTVVTTKKRADQQAWPKSHDGFGVHEVPYRAPWPLELIRKRRSTDRGDGSAAPALVASATSNTRTAQKPSWTDRFRQRTGCFAGVRMPDMTDSWVRPAIEVAQSLASAAAQPFDIVLSSSGPYTAHRVAMELRSRAVARNWVADFRDLWVDNHTGRGLPLFSVIEKRLQRRVLSEADCITTVGEALQSKLKASAGAAETPVEVVYNGFDDHVLMQLDATRILPSQTRNIVYTGTLYPRGQDPRPVLNVLARKSSWHLHVAGSHVEHWMTMAEEAGAADRITHHGPVTHTIALRMQRDADILLALQWNGVAWGGPTSKVFEYLAQPAPIMVVGGDANAPLASLVREHDRGSFCGRDSALIEAMIDSEKCIGQNNGAQREASISNDIAVFSRQKQAERMLRLVDRLCGEHERLAADPTVDIAVNATMSGTPARTP